MVVVADGGGGLRAITGTESGTDKAVMGMGPMPMHRSLLCGSVE